MVLIQLNLKTFGKSDFDLFKVNNGNTRTNVRNLFKVNNKGTRTTPLVLFGVFINN